ncbi:acyl carrier protein [Psychromicrobium sp. YIM B11713]|uniref:acyl carrier protein n=1 Tax=Psychromicrobium sp. YIM B11713 TaxID=3145233 RepID=UPI00374E7B7D
MESTLEKKIRETLSDHAKLAVGIDDVAADGDLYAAGMTSHASVNVMLALEDEFDIEFPEKMLTKNTFSSINSIASALTEIGLD